MKKTYHGSCHCRAVTFEADIDLGEGTGKCNCTFCWKQRSWNVGQLDPADFRLITGADSLGDYGRSGDWGEIHHLFCTRCGIATHGHGRIEQIGGKHTFSVRLAALDDLPVEELIAAPVQYQDGLHDNWWNAPAETRHL
jgi:hypothetical protein